MRRRVGKGGQVAMDRLLRSGTVAGVSDGELLERFASRHDEAAEAAFAAIVERHGPMVLGVCRSVLADAHDAQDAFQATFLALVSRAEALGRVKSLRPWLFGVARRVAARSRSAAARRREVERRAVAREGPVQGAVEDRCEVWDEVSRLPDELRDPVMLCYLESLTHEQAAARLGWPVGTVRSRLARARDRLRRGLARRGFEPPYDVAGRLAALPAFGVPPMSLSEATVKAALAFAARDAFEAGLVSASVVSLTEGVLQAMIVTKIQGAVVAFAAMALVSAGAFAYQDEAPAVESGVDGRQVVGVGAFAYQDAAAPREAIPSSISDILTRAFAYQDAAAPREGPEAAPPQAPPSQADSPKPRVGLGDPKVATAYLEAINLHAQSAHRDHESNDLDAALVHTQAIEDLAREWNVLLGRMKSGGERASATSSSAPRAESAQPSAAPGAPALTRESSPATALGLRNQFPQASEPRGMEDSGRAAAAPTDHPDPDDLEAGSRIERVERKLDQILRALGQQGRPQSAPTGVPGAPAAEGLQQARPQVY